MSAEIRSGEKREFTDSKIYDIEGNPITLRWKEFEPKEKLNGGDRRPGIVFNPGWAIPANGIAASSLCQEFADFSGIKTFSIEARGDPRNIKQLDAAEATRRFILEQKINEITIVGNSQGGVRAIYEAALLNPDMKVNGLILLASMGLYAQPKRGFLTNLAIDGMRTNKVLREPGNETTKKEHAQSMSEIFGDFIMQVKEAHGNIPAGIKNLRSEMIIPNPRLADVTAPVVLIQGVDDLMSNVHEFVPPELGFEAAQDFARKLRAYKDDPEGISEPTGIIARRSEHLMKELFPNSIGVKMIIAEKLGVHGLPYLRYGQTARGALIALERLNRNHDIKQPRLVDK